MKLFYVLVAEEILMSFGEKLRALRMQAGLTQEKLAAALDVTKRTIINYELENSFPPIATLHKISRHFGVSIGTLMTEEEEFLAIRRPLGAVGGEEVIGVGDLMLLARGEFFDPDVLTG